MAEDHVKMRRRRGPNKDKTPLGRSTPASAFARGTPIDPRTQLPPGEEIMIDREAAEQIPLDPESSRVAAQHHETMTRKARGESGVRWNAEDRIRYRECAMLHPNARVSFKDTVNGFNTLPSTFVSACRDYDELIAYVRKNIWKGDRVTIKWTIEDDTQPQWATGSLKFDAKDDNMGQQQPPGYGPPGYGPPGYGPPPPPQAGPQWGVPGWFGGQYWDGRNWGPASPQVAPPPPPPPPPPPAPPAQASPSAAPPMAMLTGPDAHTAYLHEEIRRLHDELNKRNQPPPPPQQPQVAPAGWYGDKYWNGAAWLSQPQAPSAQGPAAPVAQPDKPLSPIETAKSAVQMVLDLNKMSNELKSTLVGPQPEEPPETELPKNEDPFPMQVQDFGTFRMAAIREGDGPAKLVEGAMPFAMLNMDKVAAGAKSLLGQIGDFMDMRIKQGTQANDQQAAARRRSVEDAERLARAQKEIAEAHAIEAQAEALKAAALQAQHALAASAPVAAPTPPPIVEPVPEPKPSNGASAAPVREQVTEREPPKTEPEHEPPEPEQQAPSLSFATPRPNGTVESEPEPENLAVSEEPKVPVLSEN